MSHFYGKLHGRRNGTSTRCGDKSSGLTATANGWNIGGTVTVTYNSKTECDEVVFTLTGGSNRTISEKFIAQYTIHNGEIIELVKPQHA
jgi:hypothetical protein